QRARVLTLCLEDGKDEIRRRLRAPMDHYNIDRDVLAGWLFAFTPTQRIDLAPPKDGHRDFSVLEMQIRKFVTDHKIDLVSFDPFVKLHSADENDNTAIDIICSLLSRMAIDLNIAVDILHHEKKGTPEPGDPNRGRGASSRRDAGRLEYTLTSMSP